MRKYFLLSAVALLATTSANAATDYANMDISVNITYATKINCTQDLSFGQVVIDANATGEQYVDMIEDGFISDKSSGVVSVENSHAGSCDFNLPQNLNGKTIELDGGVDGDLLPSVTLHAFDNYLSGRLNIPENYVSGGDYSATITIVKPNE
ncbi:MAG: hypothetical protein IJF12_04950 [Alphaproteobacteria bacterium]|nr:hypothetical protein [Alphaproteobacteria bacterium]